MSDELKELANAMRQVAERKRARSSHQWCLDTAGEIVIRSISAGAFAGSEWVLTLAGISKSIEQGHRDAVFYQVLGDAVELEADPPSLRPSGCDDLTDGCDFLASVIELMAVSGSDEVDRIRAGVQGNTPNLANPPSPDWILLAAAGQLYLDTVDPDHSTGLALKNAKGIVSSAAKTRAKGSTPIATQGGSDPKEYNRADVLSYAMKKRNEDIED